MLADPGSYSISNFVSFTGEVYDRLFVRQFEAWWPAPILMFVVGITILVLACLGKTRALALGLAVPLAFTAITFHFKLHAELSPLGKFFGWAFLIQIPLLLAWSLLDKHRETFRPNFQSIAGIAIAAFSLIGYPLLTLGEEYGWKGAEYFGMAPDPTICLCLGLTPLCIRARWALLLLPIPLLWTITTWGTLDTFDSDKAIVLPLVALISIVATAWKAIAQRPSDASSDD